MGDNVLEQLPKVSPSSDSPVWFQVLRSIEFGISTRLWTQGDQLPSEHQLREHFSVSRTSIREALARLEKSGLISRQQGKGSFVDTPSSPWSWALHSAPSLLGEYGEGNRSALTSEILKAGVEQLPPWAAAVFRDNTEGQGVVLERVRSVGKLKALHVVNYLPKRLAGILPNLRDPRASLYAIIQSVADEKITRMHRTIEAVSADRRLARILDVEEGSPILVIEAVAYDENDDPIDFSRASVRTDRLRITVNSTHDGTAHESPSGDYPDFTAARQRHQTPLHGTHLA